MSRQLPNDLKLYSANITTATDTTIDAGKQDGRICVWQLCLENNHATVDGTLTFKDNATAMNGAGFLLKAAGGNLTLPHSDMPWFKCTKGNPLVLTTAGAATISGFIQYSIEPN